jgi:8-oxo-dGTP pyrophosphatase MutT (NUDIX family)
MQEEVVLIRQFWLGGHIALRGAMIELPAGRADPNEDEYQAAVREC